MKTDLPRFCCQFALLLALILAGPFVAGAAGGERVTVSPKKTEAEYDFRKRLSAPRAWRGDDFSGAPRATDEVEVGDDWTFVVESDEPVVRHAAADLKDFLEKRCWARCGAKDGRRRVVVAVAPEKNPLTARLTVTTNEVRVTGATPREAAQACYRLEADSQLGWEPSMRYVTSPRCLKWKLEQLASVRP